MKIFISVILVAVITSCASNNKNNKIGSWEELKLEANQIGKPEWHPMLLYVAELHEKSTHPAKWPFQYEWEEIGPGYVHGPAFGHWDLIHQVIDVLPSFPEHAYHQLLNNIENQEPTGLIPGSIWMPGTNKPERGDSARWSKDKQGHPPFWMCAVGDYFKITKDKEIINQFYNPLISQIGWFENSRKADGEGFFYNDILIKRWESGIDEGIRFDETSYGSWACIDATSHVYLMYKTAIEWSNILGIDSRLFEKREKQLKAFIQNDLYDNESGLFFDIWAMKDTSFRTLAFETLFPLAAGVATKEQANRLIDEYLLDTTCFNTPHPVSTVGKRDPRFELRMWRGASWNSMTYWIARACVDYGREDAAKILLEKALDQSAKQFEITGTIWEFYHPLGGSPQDVQRKPHSRYNVPCKDYLGHNPLIAMARMYDMVGSHD